MGADVYPLAVHLYCLRCNRQLEVILVNDGPGIDAIAPPRCPDHPEAMGIGVWWEWRYGWSNTPVSRPPWEK